jgi:hypothetical protein
LKFEKILFWGVKCVFSSEYDNIGYNPESWKIPQTTKVKDGPEKFRVG